MQAKGTIAHYTIESRIGSGGMGEVYLATDTRLHRKVAIKIIQHGGTEAESQESAMRLLREARTAAALTHPNVVSIFDVGEHEGRVYLAMEYVVGKTLRELVGAPEPSWPLRLRFLLDVARALAAAHRKGLVHRDIKPENVMVRDEDNLVKVLDFGIARRAISEVDPNGRTEVASMATLTGKGQIIGTPMYMAPEQIKGNVCDARSDQFAWGVLAFELLAGKRPWPEKNDLLAAVAQVLTEEPASLQELAPAVPAVVCDVIHRALARSPEARFSSMEEIAELIESHAAGSSSRAVAPKGSDTKKSVAVPEGVEVKRPAGRGSDAGVPHGSDGAPTKNAMVTERSLGAEPPPPEPPRARKRLVFALGMAAGIALLYGGYRAIERPHPVKPPAIDAAAEASTKLPEDSEASLRFSEGMQLFKDGAWNGARVAFEAAEKADPAFPAPSLMLALALQTSDESGRDAFSRAVPKRARLAPADLALLDAMDPVVMGGEPDYDTAQKRAQARLEHENDANVAFWLGWVLEQRSDFEGALKAYEKAIAWDASFSPARRGRAHALAMLGRSEPALAELDECIKRSRAAAICLRARLRLLDDQGKCGKMETDARAWANVEPEASEPDYLLAVALAAQKAPPDAVQEALKRQWKKVPAAARNVSESSDRADLNVLSGDFTGAERAVKAWDSALPEDADVLRRAAPARMLVHLAFEQGDVQRAGDIADAFEKRMKGYPQHASGVDPSLGFDEFLYRADRMKKDELDLHRKSWLARAESRETQREKMRHVGERWALIYASFAESLEEAKEALARFDEFQPMPPKGRENLEFAANVGKTYALAGKSDDAIAYLERVTRSCSALRNPLLHTRSFYFLGQAREDKGDLAAAREAYKEVVDRWGSAKPRSMTADRAKARLAAITL